MKQQADLYALLGVARDATKEELKLAYRRLATACHPDKTQDDPEKAQRFKDAKAAYNLLSDPETREHYDRTGNVPNKQSTEQIKAQALSQLASLFVQMVLKMPNAGTDDCMTPLYQTITITQQQIRNQLRQCTSQMTKMLTARKRIKRKDGGINVLEGALIEQINMLEQSKWDLEGQLEIGRYMREFLDEYQYYPEAIWQLQGTILNTGASVNIGSL